MKKPANVSVTNRSKVSNGTRLFLDGVPVDGRSAVARRFRDHIADLECQVGGEPTPAQAILIRNAAMLATQCELDQAKLAAGEPVEEQAFVNRCNALIRTLTTLGLQRAAKDVTPAPIDAHARAVRGAKGKSK